ncbi:MurR/RpiR family transcriptional regulator [Pandoraea fibrosis]|uniref:Transcriptional regulator n=1 Tax=Pandoraea fibrosis TaxID=1891094 RepID=A0A5E4SLB1_9BURK|nr:MurR/RpiR family transcriptional regulator [Pandoraea fibrosis]VVD75088.1 transcriptional regulator [Pandoraea fibrosis]
MTKDELEKVISMRFQEMPPKLRQAARYVLDSPKEVALQSMRTVAARAQLQPASMLRLARDLGFSSYEDFRSVYIDWLSAGPSGPSGLLERAEQVREHSRASGDDQLLAESLAHEYGNLEATLSKRNEQSFHEAVDLLRNASRIYVLGLRSLYPPAFYLHYVLSTFQDNVTLISGEGGALIDDMRRIGKTDVLLCFTARPYTVASVETTRFARQRGATVVAVSDSTLSPVAAQAHTCIVAPNTSLSLFPSILPALAVAQTLAQLLMAHGGEETLAEVANSAAQLHEFNIYTAED